MEKFELRYDLSLYALVSGKRILTSLPYVDFLLDVPDRLHQFYIECVHRKDVSNPTPRRKNEST